MKLSLLAATVLAYTVLAVSWLCYAEPSLPAPHNLLF
jgi:hypothetical protein